MGLVPGTAERPLRVAVVGSGPSGFYAIGALFKSNLEVSVDLFDRLPTPFGLVRGGVAPDHQKIKNVIRVYNKTASDPGFRFFGNVMLGRDLSVEDLLAHYDQVVVAVGNESDRALGVPGEELDGVYSATEFVGWYNGHPDFQDRHFDLARARRVAVVGNGNVAMDVTRILAHRPDDLAATDITEESLAELRRSQVQEIVLLGRRGPAQAAFSPKEIKEVGELAEADLVIDRAAVELDELSSRWLESADRSARKNVEYLQEQAGKETGEAPRSVRCLFLVSPVELLGDDHGHLRAVRVEHNELYEDDRGTPRPRGTGEIVEIEADLLFKAVGYRGIAVPGLPFHDRWGIIPNQEGRITAEDGAVLERLYVVGWAKRGPSGLIGTNGPDSEATVTRMLEDVPALGADPVADPSAGSARLPEAIVQLLEQRDIDFVSFEDWQLLDTEEIRRGEGRGKIRDKLTSVDAMMAALQELRTRTT